MKVTIEIKETNINASEIFNATSYEQNGIYLNTDENGILTYVAAIKEEGFVLCMGNKSQFTSIFGNDIKPDIINPELAEFPEPLEEIEQVVSESFALKMVAIVLNKEKFNDVE